MRPMWDGAAGTLEERGPGLRFPRPKNKTNQVRRAKKEWSMRDGAAGALEEREPGLRFPRPKETPERKQAEKRGSMWDGAAGALEEREPGLRFPRPIARRVKSMVANGKNGNEI